MGPLLMILLISRLPSPASLLHALTGGPLYLLVLSLALNAVAIHLKVMRWRVLLEARGICYPMRQAWVAFAASVYLGMVTPGRVGDLIRIRYLEHDVSARRADGIASVLVDRLLDLGALALSCFGALVYLWQIWPPTARWIVLGLSIAGLAAPAVLLVPHVPERALAYVHRRFTGKEDAPALREFSESVRVQAGAFAKTAPLTALSFLLAFGQGWLVARATGIDLSYATAGSLSAIASLLSLLPISISGVGLREGFYAQVFPSLGFDAERGIAYGLACLVTLYLGVAAIGFVAWQIRPPPAG